MLIGYNNDVQYRDKTFHIQTEDRGLPAKEIETQIFHAGAILDTRILSYAETYDGEADVERRNASIKTLMQNTHRELYKNLFAGKYDQYAGLSAETSESAPLEDSFIPSQERVPAGALEVEAQGAEAFALKHEEDHVDLKSLKARLAQMSAGGGVEEEEDGQPTQVVEPEEVDILSDFGASPAPPSPLLPSKPKAPPAVPPVALSGLNRSFQKSVRAKLPGASSQEEYATSKQPAWKGAWPASEDLKITELVEAYLAKQ